MRTLRFVFFYAALAITVSGQLAAQGTNATIGDALFAAGFTRTVWVSYDNVAVRVHGIFDPTHEWLGDVTSFELRYGAGSWHQKGNVVGERYSDDVMEFLVHHESNPFGLSDPDNYVVGLQDRQDAVMASRGSGRSVWDDYIVPLATNLAPPPEPICPPFSPQICYLPE